jgi:hypothetical protein
MPQADFQATSELRFQFYGTPAHSVDAMSRDPIALCFQLNTVACRKSTFGEDDGRTGRSTNTARAQELSASRTARAAESLLGRE